MSPAILLKKRLIGLLVILNGAHCFRMPKFTTWLLAVWNTHPCFLKLLKVSTKPVRKDLSLRIHGLENRVARVLFNLLRVRGSMMISNVK